MTKIATTLTDQAFAAVGSIGIETAGGSFVPVLSSDHAIPCSASRVFTTVADNQARVEVHVLEGHSDIAAENRSLVKLEVTDLPPAPRGVPQIDVTFKIDSNARLTVKARDRATGHEKSVSLSPGAGLSLSEVQRLVEEAQQDRPSR
jgi:molecular chaperone DnaK